MTRRPYVTGARDIEAAGFGRVRPRHQRGGIPKYHPIKSVAEALEVSSRTVRRWIESGELVVHRVGGIVRIAEDDLRAFLALHRET